MAERRLGKGLDELFGADIDKVLDDISSSNGSGPLQIDIDIIRPNPYQPRKTFDQEKLRELADSISQHGVFQPILLRKAIGGYELVAGERRLRAAKMASLTTIPAIVLDFSDEDMMEISILENIQRENLSPIEEARAYEELINKLGYTQEKLAQRLAKSRSNITNILRLLKLPLPIQEMVKDGRLTYGHARALLSLDDEDKMLELAQKTIKEGLSVRALEKLVQAKPAKPIKPKNNDPYLNEIRHKMEDSLGTAVTVTKKSITIHYNNNADLNRILESLGYLDNSLLDE